MLYPYHAMLIDKIRQEKTRDYMRQAQMDHLTDLAISHRPSTLPHPICNTLHQLGHMFMNLGNRLERLETPQTI